jgi:hypothetical protein
MFVLNTHSREDGEGGSVSLPHFRGSGIPLRSGGACNGCGATERAVRHDTLLGGWGPRYSGGVAEHEVMCSGWISGNEAGCCNECCEQDPIP